MYLLRALSFSGVLIWVMRVDTRARRNSVSFSTPVKQGSSVFIFAWLCWRTHFSTVSCRYIEKCYSVTVHIFLYWQWSVKSYISIYFIRFIVVCQYFLMTWFAHNATDGILFWPFFCLYFLYCLWVWRRYLLYVYCCWATKCWFVVNEIGCSFSMLIRLMFSLVYMSDVLWVGTCASGQTLG